MDCTSSLLLVVRAASPLDRACAPDRSRGEIPKGHAPTIKEGQPDSPEVIWTKDVAYINRVVLFDRLDGSGTANDTWGPNQASSRRPLDPIKNLGLQDKKQEDNSFLA
jgi:hypothetical protein